MIKDWTQKEWRLKKAELEERLEECKIAGYFNVKRYGANIAIEGSYLPMIFGDNGKVKVWNRASRCAGAQVLISDLVKIEKAIRLWMEEQRMIYNLKRDYSQEP